MNSGIDFISRDDLPSEYPSSREMRLCTCCKSLIEGAYYSGISKRLYICRDCGLDYARAKATKEELAEYLTGEKNGGDSRLHELDRSDLMDFVDAYFEPDDFSEWYYSGDWVLEDSGNDYF